MRAGKRFFLDTSGPALQAAWRGVYLLKPSLRELQELTGRKVETATEQEQAAREAIAAGRADIVVLSLGADGALLASAAGIERFAAIPIEAKSTVGVGDSMLAGIVLALSAARACERRCASVSPRAPLRSSAQGRNYAGGRMSIASTRPPVEGDGECPTRTADLLPAMRRLPPRKKSRRRRFG